MCDTSAMPHLANVASASEVTPCAMAGPSKWVAHWMVKFNVATHLSKAMTAAGSEALDAKMRWSRRARTWGPEATPCR